jgi:peptidoglycan hydrolase-like protein with peptidoglycan-binding domain
MAILKAGMTGEPVKRLQQRLGVPADGQFGPATEKALKAYQQQNNLTSDGIAGPDTFSQMGLHELVLLMPGTSGETVKKLQRALGIDADGQYGPATAAAVKKYQQEKSLEADGLAGPVTLASLATFSEMTPKVVEASKASEQVVADSPQDVLVKAGKSIWQTVKGIFSR